MTIRLDQVKLNARNRILGRAVGDPTEERT